MKNKNNNIPTIRSIKSFSTNNDRYNGALSNVTCFHYIRLNCIKKKLIINFFLDGSRVLIVLRFVCTYKVYFNN